MFASNTCSLLLDKGYVSPGTTSPIKIKNTGSPSEAMACMKFSEGLCERLKGRVVLDSVSLHENDFYPGLLNKEALNFRFLIGPRNVVLTLLISVFVFHFRLKIKLSTNETQTSLNKCYVWDLRYYSGVYIGR